MFRVGLDAPLPVIEAREATRGDRMPGLARAQAGVVHRGARYDLRLDTCQLTPEACAAAIVEAMALTSRPQGRIPSIRLGACGATVGPHG
ncbi:MAG: hypothetical protein KDK12_17755 [Rhodobacteraceae bacterium]|nr:hypothetical protein [Paracoccaceae bacterium]